MTVASELAAFLTAQNNSDIPAQAIEHAQMLVASTIASAAMGTTIESSQIIRALESERGRVPQATAWFGACEKLPAAAAARINAVMSDAAASDDSDLRNIIHTGTIDGMKKPTATGRQAENTASAAALMPAISDSTQITTAGDRTSR